MIIIYTKAYNGKMIHLQGIIFKMTLQDFINLMFSKSVDCITYEQLEKGYKPLQKLYDIFLKNTLKSVLLLYIIYEEGLLYGKI